MTPVPNQHVTAPVGTAPVGIVWTTVGSPLGELLLTGALPTDGAEPRGRGGRSTAAVLTGLYYPGHARGPVADPGWREDPAAFEEVAAQLAAYFRGARTTFSVPVRTVGTPFQERVWEALRAVPFGTTTTYGELARRVGRPRAARAVGAAVGRNPVSVVVPCHRVVGRSGTLTGYAGGVARKEHLLALEGVLATAAPERKATR